MSRRLRLSKEEKRARKRVRKAQKRADENFKVDSKLAKKRLRLKRKAEKNLDPHRREIRRLRSIIYIVTAVCIGFLAVALYFIIERLNPNQYGTNAITILSLAAFVAVISAIFMVGILIFYELAIVKPVTRISDAARKVANGDFTVRLQPRRRKNRKETENLFEETYMNFNIMVGELASIEILKSDFVSNVSHELKTPLAAIQSLSTVMTTGNLNPEEMKDYAERISQVTRGLSTLVTNILQLSRLENQKILVHKAKYNLSEQLSRCILSFETVWEERNIDIEPDLDESIQLDTDESLMDIVWHNLLSNALKFTDDGGRVSIKAYRDGDSAVVSVSDTGCGIQEKDIRHIFDKFYQGDTSRATKGNGLGLALTKEIVELLKADISVSSVVGDGSTFTVRMEAVPEEIEG